MSEQNYPDDPDYSPKSPAEAWNLILRKTTPHAAAITAIATVVLAITTISYALTSAWLWSETKKSTQIARDTPIASQGAYVTIGRRDGVVAEFIVPKDDPKQNAELVIYFQNNGHVPARIAWNMNMGLTIGRKLITDNSPSGLAIGGNNFGLTYKSFSSESSTSPLSPSFRFKKYPGKYFEGESSVIAGDSILIGTLGTITQADLKELPHNVAGMTTDGYYEYCDQLGNLSTHHYGLRYRPDEPSSNLSFELALDNVVPNAPIPADSEEREYFPPCTPITVLARGKDRQ